MFLPRRKINFHFPVILQCQGKNVAHAWSVVKPILPGENRGRGEGRAAAAFALVHNGSPQQAQKGPEFGTWSQM